MMADLGGRHKEVWMGLCGVRVGEEAGDRGRGYKGAGEKRLRSRGFKTV